ncbi:hypothetical protein F4809DRAFT_461998 [Biscogniauxia mediterranea]|nr:hypothetical protein F4809DRAFT_461998 [Biscogniauxia mediterranea]
MSANSNTESMAQQGGEFHNRVPPSGPMTTKGHQPGVKVGNERVPEFHMEAHAPGTAPREDTYQPHPEGQVPAQSDTHTDPSDTLGGATSQDVYRGLGKPVQGQEGRELHGEHLGRRKKERAGLEGVGASVGVDSVRQKGADLPEGVVRGGKNSATAEYPSAEERVPVSAEELAAERKA